MLTLKKYTPNILGTYNKGDDIIELLLKNRNLEFSPEQRICFFSPSFRDLHDPLGLLGMGDAIMRIFEAREKKQRVVIFGDYDVDGVSSTAMLVRFFHQIGIEVSYRLPHRVKDGYGLKPYFIDELLEKDVKLIITVDCGTRDIESIRYAKEKGIDMIVTDHHAVPEEIPEGTIALINPKDPNSLYPFSHLSGSGVAFKLLSAVAKKLYPEEKEYISIIREYIDFATLGTIADCMPLIGENRTIATLGLKQLKQSQSHGLKRLIEGNDGKELDSDIVGFRIGPRINAAGRMDSPYKALQMLLAGEDRLDDIMSDIENLNTKRKVTTEKFAKHAFENIDDSKPILIYDSTSIEHGIIGLIAGRLCEAYHKPAIALKDEGEKLVASCRSPEYFNMVVFLEGFKSYFIAFGGHKQAAGFSIQKDKFEEFLQVIQTRAADVAFAPPEQKTLRIDAIMDIDMVNLGLVQTISAFKPFGIGNPKPLFLVKNISTSGAEYLGKDQKHVRFKIEKTGVSSKAFGFGQYFEEIKNAKKIHLVVELEENNWNGRVTVDLNVKDIILDEE